MKRKNFIRNGVVASAATLFAPVLSGFKSKEFLHKAGYDGAFNLNYAFHEGMFSQHAGASFLDQIKYAHSLGFRSIEDNGMMARTPEMQQQIGDLLRSLKMDMGVFVITSDNWHWKTSLTTGKKEYIDQMETDCHKAIKVAKRCGAIWVTVVPGNYDRSLPVEQQSANVIAALRKAAAILEPHGLIMVLEPLSDNSDLFLRHSAQTYLVCKSVNSPSCKILFDIYHMQRNEGNIIANMDRFWEEIAYIQIGDNPGRNEPGTGEINYKNIFKHLYNKGYKGILGMEHGISGKGKEGEVNLIKAYRESDAFL